MTALLEATDEQLVTRYLAGDFEAFNRLYSRYRGATYRYLYQQLRHDAGVDDVFQELWIKVVTKLSQFNAQASFSTWLYTIARHQVIDHARHVKVLSKHFSDDEQTEEDAMSMPEKSETPSLQLSQSRQRASINYCLDRLALHQKDCFLLREEAGFSAREIALVVNAGTEAVKSRLRAAYQNLRECLDRQDAVTNDTQHPEQGEG